MNILSISSLLPIPGIVSQNDFVFQIYKYNQQLFHNDQVIIIRPLKYDLNLFHMFRKNTYQQMLKGNYSRIDQNFPIEIVHFFSSWSYRNIHAFLTWSIYYINKGKINKLMREHQIDVIHAQYIFPDGLLAYMLNRKFNIPYFLTTHNEKFYFKSYFSRYTALKIMNQAAKVLPINYTNYLYYKSLGVINIEFLPLGFSTNFIREQKTSRDSKVRIFTAAQIIPLKNIDKVIRAIKMLTLDHDISYSIIGSGTEKIPLVKLTNQLGLSDIVEFIEHIPQEQMADIMYKYDIFIMPSYFETFGRVYFEAMAMGIPVICAKNSGISGFFKEMEEGISVDHQNISEIAEALRFLITNTGERLRIGRNGQNLVINYTWEYIVKRLHVMYTSALEPKQ